MLSVQTGSWEAQALDGAAMDEVLGNNFIYIFELHKAIPDSLGIDHNGRSMLALIQASGFVGADKML
jgi:hypothetical protein